MQEGKSKVITSRRTCVQVHNVLGPSTKKSFNLVVKQYLLYLTDMSPHHFALVPP